MSKHLRIWLFVLLSTLLTSTALLAEGVITMTASKAVGEKIKLRVEANGNVTIEGAQETSDYDTYTLTLTSQTVTIRGDVTELDCRESQLTSLDVSKNTALTRLVCFYNQLTSLDVSKNTALKILACQDNQLTSLDVPKNTALEILACQDNQLTSLDVSKNIALTKLLCSNNKLTSLNVSGCTRLTFIACTSNYIKGKAMTKLVNSLPNRREKSSGTLLVVDCSSQKRDRNRCSAADVTTAKRKNWEVLKDRGPYDWVSYSGD